MWRRSVRLVSAVIGVLVFLLAPASAVGHSPGLFSLRPRRQDGTAQCGGGAIRLPRSCCGVRGGARNISGLIAECMDHVAGAGSNGLNTVVTLSADAGTVCLSEAVALSGRLTIATNSNYGRLSGSPLGSRTVAIIRDGATWVSRTTGSTSGTYSATASFSTAGSHTFVSSFANERVESLTGDTSSAITVTWSRSC